MRVGLPIADGHDVHGAVTDVAEHGCSLEFRQLVRHSREALREDVAADNPDAAFCIAERIDLSDAGAEGFNILAKIEHTCNCFISQKRMDISFHKINGFKFIGK